MIKFFITWWQINICEKIYVLNNANQNVHHWDCEWCDNINDYRRITPDEFSKLLNEGKIKKSSCCFK